MLPEVSKGTHHVYLDLKFYKGDDENKPLIHLKSLYFELEHKSQGFWKLSSIPELVTFQFDANSRGSEVNADVVVNSLLTRLR